MSTFIDRLIQEEKELGEKFYKLKKFIWQNENKEQVVTDYQLDLLTDQAYYMQEYLNVLQERIANLKESE